MVFNIFMWLPGIDSINSRAVFLAGKQPHLAGGGLMPQDAAFALALAVLNFDSYLAVGTPAAIIETIYTKSQFVTAMGVANATPEGAWSVSPTDSGITIGTQVW